MCQGVTDVSQ